MITKKIFSIVFLFYSFNLFSQNIVYQPAEKYFSHIIVEKSNFDFKKDKEFNRKRQPKYLRDYAPGTFMNEFGSWDKFPSNDTMFDSISTENTENNWIKFKDKIIELSRTKKLDHISLTKCLEIVKEHSNDKALLPIAAYQCMNREHAVWVIVCLWENNSIINLIENGYAKYGHIRQYAIDITDFKIIAFETCG